MSDNPNKKDAPWVMLFLCFLLMFIAMFCAEMWGHEKTRNELKILRVEAVRNGFASYKVDDEGNTEWHWRVKPESQRQ